MIKLIGLDFDETLAPTEKYFRQAEQSFLALLAGRGLPQETLDKIHDNFAACQKQNIQVTGFGAALQLKTFLDLAHRHAPEVMDAQLAADISRITENLRNHPVNFYRDVRSFFETIRETGIPVAVITKGERLHQQSKLQTLKDKFRDAHVSWREYILGDKNTDDYNMLLRASGVMPQEFVMIGDSVKSDIEPVLALNTHAIWLNRPSHNKVKWDFEKSTTPEDCVKVKNLGEAADAIHKLSQAPRLS